MMNVSLLSIATHENEEFAFGRDVILGLLSFLLALASVFYFRVHIVVKILSLPVPHPPRGGLCNCKVLSVNLICALLV